MKRSRIIQTWLLVTIIGSLLSQLFYALPARWVYGLSWAELISQFLPFFFMALTISAIAFLPLLIAVAWVSQQARGIGASKLKSRITYTLIGGGALIFALAFYLSVGDAVGYVAMCLLAYSIVGIWLWGRQLDNLPAQGEGY